MNDEIRAAVGAHQDLGPSYNEALAEGLVERIGAEIDKRIDTRLGRAGGTREAVTTASAPPAKPPAATPPSAPPFAGKPAPYRPVTSPWVTPLVAIGSLALGVAATAVLTSKTSTPGGNYVILAVIWVVIMIVNIVYATNRT